MIDSKNCTGCGACENICPRNAIKMVYSNRGFYVPQIDEELCNNCGKCSRVCPQIDFELKNLKRPKSFAISASDEERLKSSSGGFFPTLAKYILNKNGYVVGVAWNKDWEAQHIIIDNIDDLDKLRFSKYVQAKTGDVYKKIRDLLNNNNIVLFSGTPCQNAGLLKYLNKDYDNLLTVDVLCHGVPSPKIWQEYLSQNFNKSEITGVNFRAKDNGWKYDSDAKCDTTYIEINHKRQEMKEFNYAFLKNILLNEPCLECKYRKTPRTGDFTCGDFWKYWKYDKKLCDGKGLSIVLCNNKKAEKYMNLIYKEFKIYKKINIRKPKHVELELPSKRTAKREIFFNNYKKGLSTSKLLDAVSNVHYDVGLLSQFNGLNYGSALVAYAAYEIITSMGYSVLMINKRWVGKRSNEPSPAHKNFIFANKHYDITKLYEYIDDNTELNSFVDTFITGSDTLWWDTSKAKDFFFLDFALSDKRKVAFSTSFAFDVPAINKNKQKALKYLFKRFDSISVREQSGVDILKNNFGIDDAVQIYDPTLIADRKIFDKLAEESDLDEANYILAYILDSTKEKIECIKEYAKFLNKKLIIINNPYLNFKYDYRHKPSKHKNYYPEDFVYLIKNADFIITDSFHGACFSTIYEKKFVAILNKSRGGARYKIFDDMALSHRIIKSIDEIFNIQYTDDVNFTTAKRIIMREREKGLNWLKEALTKPKRKCTDKHLNITEETIKNPLTIDEVKVSGERMILAPSMIDMNLDNDFIMQYFIRKPDPENQKTYSYGICVLTPSFNYANIWGKNGALVSNSNEISKHIGELKAGNYQNTIVFANRYDGLDLPDSACRILIFDGIPYAENLLDRYFQDCLCDSEIINVKIAQRIEQGLGRNVRSDRDFGAILLLRNDLIRFVMSNKYKKYFSPQTQKQIEIGELLVDIAKEETEESNSQVVFIELIKKILKRDDDWKAVYSDEMSNIKINKESKILEDLIIQRKAEEANYFGRSSEAVKILSEYINTNKQKLSNEEYGWYLQQIARYLYEDSKLNSINAQISAYDKNNLLLKPSSSINIKLLKSDKINQSKYIKKYIDKFETAKDLDLEVNEILDFLRFGIDSKKFENTVNRLGELLGFAAEQPDKMYNEGPDNLWAVAPNEYFVIEAKNEIYESRSFLSQVEIGQMNNTIGWFKKNYQKHKGTFIMIAPTHVIDRRVAFNDSVKIIRKKELINLKKNVACFIKDIINNDFKNIKNEEIAKLLRLHKLDYSQFTEYFVKPDDILVQKE